MKNIIIQQQLTTSLIFFLISFVSNAQQVSPNLAGKEKNDSSIKTAPAKKALPGSDYFNTRGGLQNSFDQITKKESATIAFLGGSITYNPGWRSKVCNYLIERYPKTRFHFIAAGIPSLGSLPHAFRLQRDVLDSGKTDLLFIEAAVNDRANETDSLIQVRALEGIVRHAKKSNPRMDIILMSFADPAKTNDYDSGATPVEIANHELIANHYNLPSINLAKEVRDRMRNGEFTWQDDFKDLHPSEFGQQLYFNTIKKLLSACFDGENIQVGALTKRLPAPIDKACFANGKYYSIKNAQYNADWFLNMDWVPGDSLPTREGFVHVPVLMSGKPGAVLNLPFKGTAIGLCLVSGADAGIIDFSIDNSPYKRLDLYTAWSGMLHLPWYILFDSNLKNTDHLLRIRISEQKNAKSKGNACRIVNFLVND